MHVVLIAPEIAGNTGNIIRLCANTGTTLHLVEPLGFSLEDKLLQRAGLDYHDLANVRRHVDWAACKMALPTTQPWALTSRATVTYSDAPMSIEDVLIYGCESVGLPNSVLDEFEADHQVRIPMQPNNRSLNLANSVALVVYDVWRRSGFRGAVFAPGTVAADPRRQGNG